MSIVSIVIDEAHPKENTGHQEGSPDDDVPPVLGDPTDV
jgi:hypothetical protein